jgi:hypothetical protein
MNIFYLHKDPSVSASAMTDKHVVKMILESAQMLSTAHHVLDKDNAKHQDKLYKPTHQNHPSSVWVRQSKDHYAWLYSHFLALSKEYSTRYNKVHKTYEQLHEVLHGYPNNIPDEFFSQPPQAMPDIFKDHDSVQAYRRYYLNQKINNDKDLERFVLTLWNK